MEFNENNIECIECIKLYLSLTIYCYVLYSEFSIQNDPKCVTIMNQRVKLKLIS